MSRSAARRGFRTPDAGAVAVREIGTPSMVVVPEIRIIAATTAASFADSRLTLASAFPAGMIQSPMAVTPSGSDSDFRSISPSKPPVRLALIVISDLPPSGRLTICEVDREKSADSRASCKRYVVLPASSETEIARTIAVNVPEVAAWNCNAASLLTEPSSFSATGFPSPSRTSRATSRSDRRARACTSRDQRSPIVTGHE